jgi:hypothetical protein
MVQLGEIVREMAGLPSKNPSIACYSCGKWPACGYRDLDQKHTGRICEDCVASSKKKAKR